MSFQFAALLVLTMSLPPAAPEPKLSVDVRAGNVPIAGLWRVLWPTRRRVLV
jgi:hypothetical protein